MRGPGRARMGLVAVAAMVLLAACELQEVTVVDVVDVAIAEVFVTLREPAGANEVRAFLHGTAAGGVPEARTFDDAVVQVTRRDGFPVPLALAPIEECVASAPENAAGTCFMAAPLEAAQLTPGDVLDLRITLGSGETAVGAVTLPGSFALDGLSAQCRLPADTLLEVRWSRSSGAWAYLNETTIEGLPAALAGNGIEAPDTLYLLGLSVSSSDTTIVFPKEFGIFDRFDLDQALTVRLQRGLPDQTSATVSIAAIERNYVNWVRGGNFNPSGQVRVSSLRGGAFGVFGGAVIRDFGVRSSSGPLAGVPDCP